MARAPPSPVVPRRGQRRHRRAAQRAGDRLAGDDPRVYARGVERVRAHTQLRHRLAPSGPQPRQANRADGRALAAVVRPPPPVQRRRPRCPRRRRGHRRAAGRPQHLINEALHGHIVVVVGTLPSEPPGLSGQLHPAGLARHDAEAVEEHRREEAEEVEDVEQEQEQEVPSQRELVAVVVGAGTVARWRHGGARRRFDQRRRFVRSCAPRRCCLVGFGRLDIMLLAAGVSL